MDASSISIDAGAVVQALAHFLWQGTLIAVAAAMLEWVTRPRTAQTRYAIYCCALVAMALCPIVNVLAPGGRDAAGSRLVEVRESATVAAPGGSLEFSEYSLLVGVSGDRRVARILTETTTWLAKYRQAILACWGAGMGFCGLRMIVGSVRLWAMARRGRPLPDRWQESVERLGRRMRFRRLPAVRVVDEISQAMAVGVVRPMVLLPAAWVSGLSGEMLEAVIAHELAHLGRWDLLVNLVQRVVESALFFHPAVWWCSRRIRIEREMCCDEAAAFALGNRVVYAKALSHLAECAAVAREPGWALGIGGSKMVLFERIRNVLGLGAAGHGRWYGPSCAAVGAVAASAVWGAVLLGTGSEPSAARARVSPYESHEIGVLVDPERKLYRRVLADEIARHPELLGVKNKVPEPQTQRFMFGKGVNSNAGMTGVIENAPSEHKKARLPNYTIEPPDILMIRCDRVVPKSGVNAEAQPIVGEHLVAPDGHVNLGSYGQVLVAGLTIEQAKRKIEEHLAEKLEKPEVTVEVFAYNSKVYYVITQGANDGDTIMRLPVTGNETVLDALSQINGLDGMQSKQVWIARPQPGGAAHDAILPVNWQEITRGAATATNYQVLPGDRIFVASPSPLKRMAEGALRFLEQAQATEQSQHLQYFIGVAR